MRRSLAELLRYRELLHRLTWREIRIKYKQSIMGLLWAVLMPMVIVLAGLLVRLAMSRLSGEPFAAREVAAISVKAVPWAFFVASLRFCTSSLIANANLVTRIYFPKEIFPLAAVGSQLLDLLVASGVLAVVLALLRVGVSIQLLWVPLLLVNLVVLAAGLGIFLSAASLFFRDVKYLVEVFLTFAIFFTPVFYEVELFGRWAPLLLLNPVAPLLEGLHAVVVEQQAPPVAWIAYSLGVSLLVLVAAWSFFKRAEPAFAESI